MQLVFLGGIRSTAQNYNKKRPPSPTKYLADIVLIDWKNVLRENILYVDIFFLFWANPLLEGIGGGGVLEILVPSFTPHVIM